MPKGSRIFIENACYHIIARGNNRQRLFKEKRDYEKYLTLLRRYKRRYGIRIFGYCLMPNHVHFVMQAERKDLLSSNMRALQRAYSAYFSGKYRNSGHIWQGRFKNKVILKDKYLLDCILYIESNPLRANMVSSMHEYAWSSYRSRALNEVSEILDELDNLI